MVVRPVESIVCQAPAPVGGIMRNKTCPDFKADPTFTYCCTSKLPITNIVYKDRHGVFCCSEQDFLQEQQEIADAELRRFIKNYMVLIILSTLIGICIVVIIASVVCKKFRKCPLYRDPTVLSHTLPTTSMYRPVDTIPPKIYEAPPPYECFVPPPDQLRTDWNTFLDHGNHHSAPPMN
ncbi:unnamed protein product [Auanema sp. JU1783]|nr:unnamed protein product [Auanema sp. JU1783]